jgi:hypothetical protein
MSIQFSASHPNRRSKDHPTQTALLVARQAISTPVAQLRQVLVGQYTAKQDFFSRYRWVDHHIKILHQGLDSSKFWINWTRIGNELYVQVKHEFHILRRYRDKVYAIYIRVNRYSHQRQLADSPARAIALTDLSPIENKLQDINRRICRSSGQRYVNERLEDASDVRDAIISLNDLPVAASWNEWINTHRASCVNIQSRIEALEHTTYMYVLENEDQFQKLEVLQIERLQTLFSRTLKGIALKHYVTYVSREYQVLHREVQSEIALLRNDRAIYHSSWGNYLWSYWESNHSAQAALLYQKIGRLTFLHQEYMNAVRPDQQSSLPSLTALQKSFKEVFYSFEPQNAVNLVPYPLTPVIPEEWKGMRHRGIPISCGESKLGAALQLMFSDPALAKYIFRGPRQMALLGQLYDSYLHAQWNAQWATLGTFIQTMDPAKPITFDQFIYRLDSLYSSHPANRWYLARPFYDLVKTVANRTSHGLISAFLSRLDKEKSPLFYTLVHQTMGATGITHEHQTQQSILHLDCPKAESPETLENLLEYQFNHHQEKTYFITPPEYLFIFLHRDEQATETLVGIQEQFFLKGGLTVSNKGKAYELVSFTSLQVHYRKTDFGYIRIDNGNAGVEDISQLDFLIAAQSCTDCVFRRSNAELTEQQLEQETYNNRLRFCVLQFKINAIRSVYGCSNFKIPAQQQQVLQYLVDFIQLVATSKSFAERILETAFNKNPNDDLEQAFNKLPIELQNFLWAVWKSSDGTTIEDKGALLRDLRNDILSSADSGALSIPPVGNERQYDQDRFVLTLMADRLVKHFERHTEDVLKNKMESFLLQEILHGVSQAVREKRMRLIRYSGAAEEAIHLTVTLVFSNLLEKGEELLARQAVSSGARLISVIYDPLQDNPLFQSAMRVTTTMILLGQSLDDPELSEEHIRNIGTQFFARQGLALVPSRHVPQNLKDFVVATFSTMLFQNPSHLINWGVSTSFDLINSALVEELPPDVPQSRLNFYAARILNPLSTNAALQAYAAEKVTEVGLRLLSSIEDSDPVLEDLTTAPMQIEEAVAEAPLETQAAIDRLPQPELVHSEYYIDTRNSFRVYDNQRLEGDDYGKFNSYEEAQKFVQELKGIHLADNSRKLTLYNLKVKALLLGINPDNLPDDPNFTNIRLALEVTTDSVKLYKGSQRIFKVSKSTIKKAPKRFESGITEVRKHAHTHNVTNDGLLQSYETEVRSLFPAHIMAPEPIQKAFPIIKHTNTVCTITPSGEVSGRVTFESRDQAKSIRFFHAGHEVDIYTCQTIRFEMEKQAVQHGVAIESIPQCAPFVQTELQVEVRGRRHFSLRVNGKTAHTFKGSTAFADLEDRLLHYRTTDRGANQRALNEHQIHLSTLTNAPITQTRPIPSEINALMHGMLPPVKTEKEHGFWFKGWRSAKMTGSKGVQWLRDIGLAGASIDVVQSGFNAPKNPKSTPSYAAPYGPIQAGPSSEHIASTTLAPSLSKNTSDDAQISPSDRQPFNPPTIDAPTFGPQNPFLPSRRVEPYQPTLPLLPPSLISHQEIAARAGSYQGRASALPLLETPLLPATTPMKTTARVSPLNTIIRGVVEHLQHSGLFPKTSNVRSGITTTRSVIQVDSDSVAPSHLKPEEVKFPEAQEFIDRLNNLRGRIATFECRFQEPATLDNAGVSKDPQTPQLVFQLPTLEQLDAVHKIFTSDFAKSFPKGPLQLAKAVCTLMLPDMSDVPGAEDPREHLNRVYNNAIKEYDTLFHIKDPNSFESKSSVFISEGLCLGGIGKVMRAAESSFLMMGCEGGLFGVVIAEANDTNKVAAAIIGFGGGALSKFLLKIPPIQKAIRRRQISHYPEISSRELQFLDTINRPCYHSGVNLGKRPVVRIKPVELPYVERGPELEWWKQACPRIDRLRNLEGLDKFDRYLRATFKKDYLSELQIRRVLDYSGFETYPRPQGLPSNCIVEFSKENGGMIYRRWATRNNENMVVRVMPKNLNSLNPAQQRPYVVQARNKDYLTINGEWIDEANELTHIPLEAYEFKGW